MLFLFEKREVRMMEQLLRNVRSYLCLLLQLVDQRADFLIVNLSADNVPFEESEEKLGHFWVDFLYSILYQVLEFVVPQFSAAPTEQALVQQRNLVIWTDLESLVEEDAHFDLNFLSLWLCTIISYAHELADS